MIDIIIGIQNMGSDTGPTFDLYSDLDGYQVPFEIDVSKVDLLVGYTTTAPTGSTIIRVKSKGECETYIDIPILEPTTTTTTTLPPETTTTTTSTTTTTTSTTLPPDTTTTTTVNKELIITNVEWDISEGMYLVYFTSNFALTQLAIQTSFNGVNWSAPEVLSDLSSPQLFIPSVLYSNTFYVRIFDSNLGDITYSNVYQYFEPLTSTSTTTTSSTVDYLLRMSSGADSPYSVDCSTHMSNPNRYTIETLPVLSDYPQPGKVIYNANGTPFNGGNKYYRIQFLYILSTIRESIIARVASNGVIYAEQQICSESFGF